MFDLDRRETALVLILTGIIIAGLALRMYTMAHPAVTVIQGAFEPSANEEMLAPEDLTRIDINKAGVEELMKLRGVGKVLATRIVEYRSSRGPFTTPNDIINVKGVNKKLLDRIKNYIDTQ
ncbi:MAG: helix-hairpin-helix domain-containing protein [Candidatus Omnitrophica bacterium]|nr:helix-hairpin-helix domain-containing protein [Candidatus Omnitrophota bacterium]